VLLGEVKKKMDGVKVEQMHDMCSAGADVLHQDLETLAVKLKEQDTFKLKNDSTDAFCKSNVRCENIKTGLRAVLGDGLRDCSFSETSGRKDEGNMPSRARTHHAIYLFSPAKGQGAIHQALQEVQVEAHVQKHGVSGPSLATGLKEEAKLLNEAFKKYSIILQWVDTFSTIDGIAASSLSDINTANAAVARRGARGRVTDVQVRCWCSCFLIC